MTKITILVDETVKPAQVKEVEQNLIKAGVISPTYDHKLAAFDGEFGGDMESLKSIPFVEEVAPKGIFPKPKPVIAPGIR